MKPQVLALFGALATGLLLMTGTGTAEAQATRVEFSGTQTCVSTSAGQVMFPDGNIHVRGETSTCATVTTLAVSTDYVVSNLNLDANGSGPIWGTVRGEIGGVVVFEGAWRGTFTGPFGPDATWTVVSVAHGRGPLEGTQIFVSSECHPAPGGSACDVSGYMLVP